MPFETNYFVSNNSAYRDATFKITLLWPLACSAQKKRRERKITLKKNQLNVFHVP